MSMRIKSFYLFLLLILSVVSSFSQSKDEKKILDIMRLEEKYWSAGDIEGYVSLYAPGDSTRMILSKGAAYSRGRILAFYKKYWPKEKISLFWMAKDWKNFQKDIIMFPDIFM